jgi:alanyl-tRNA synthetase
MPAARLYYDDPSLTEFTASVADIREHSRGVWQLALDRSAFYPASGGQPFDTGTLLATAPSGTRLIAQISNVEEDESGEVWHTTDKPLAAGTPVTGRVDPHRRLDHMQQHSGQHVLSAAFDRELKASTVSFHLGDTTSTIDLAIPELPTAAIRRIERLANEIIAEDRAVDSQTIARTDAEALLASGALRKLPERAGSIRLIRIADFDLNACGGTHVRSTGQIGGLHIRSIEKVRQGMRVEFVCGLRAAAASRADFELLTESANTLSIPASELPAAIQRLLAEKRSAAKELHARLEDLALYEAKTLIAETPLTEGRRVVERTLPARDLAALKMLASNLIASAPSTIVLLANDADPANIVFARSADLTLDCGSLLKDTLATHGGKGGGSKEMAQGSVPRANFDTCLADLSALTR